MTVSEHLRKFHQAASSHHRAMAKAHKTAMGKAVDGNPEHEFHKAGAAEHEMAARGHDEMCQTCEKAIMSDLNKIVPTQVTAINPNPELRSIPRAGQRELPEKPVADPQFARLVSVEDSAYDQ